MDNGTLDPGTGQPGEIFKPAADTFMAAVPWTKNRMVVVFLRERNKRKYVRCRTFNRHSVKQIWYPSPRFYMVPVETAEELGKAIIAVAKGERYGEPPGWWFDFIKQYEAGEWRRGRDYRKDWSKRYDQPITAAMLAALPMAPARRRA
jgi:hypothetical protein